MNLQLTKGIRRWLFPEGQLVEEGTKKIDQIVRAIRGATTQMNEQTACLTRSDKLRSLVESMREGSRQ